MVNGDPVAMRRGDLLLTPDGTSTDITTTLAEPMAWLDGLDIPISEYIDVGFFEFGADRVTDESPRTQAARRAAGAHPGRGLSQRQTDDAVSSPLSAYRWEYIDRALTEQLPTRGRGIPATVEPGHAADPYVNPTTGGDVDAHDSMRVPRFARGRLQRPCHEVGSSVWQVFEGSGTVVLGGEEHLLGRGDIFVVPSWVSWSLHADGQFDLFRFNDGPIIDRLGFRGRSCRDRRRAQEWTRRHVVAHVGLNARALTRLTAWAATVSRHRCTTHPSNGPRRSSSPPHSRQRPCAISQRTPASTSTWSGEIFLSKPGTHIVRTAMGRHVPALRRCGCAHAKCGCTPSTWPMARRRDCSPRARGRTSHRHHDELARASTGREFLLTRSSLPLTGRMAAHGPLCRRTLKTPRWSWWDRRPTSCHGLPDAIPGCRATSNGLVPPPAPRWL